jgi:hypothetical protein
MSQKNDSIPIFAIILAAVVALLFKTCSQDPVARTHVLNAANGGVNFVVSLVGVVLLVFGGGGAVLMLSEVFKNNVPFEEWGWRFGVAAGIGLFGLWVISHST